MMRSFRHVFTLVVVAAATLPVLTLAYFFIDRISDITFTNAYGKLELIARGTTDTLGHALDRLADQTRAASSDSDIRRGISSVLFLGRADARLAELVQDNPVASAFFLVNAAGETVTAAPAAALAQTLPAEVIERAVTLVRANAKTLDFLNLPAPTWLPRHLQEIDGTPTDWTRRLFAVLMPITGAVGQASGVIVAVVPVDRLLSTAEATLPSGTSVHIGDQSGLWGGAEPTDDSQLTAAASVAAESLKAFGPVAVITVGEPRALRFEPVRRAVQQSTAFVAIAVVAFAVIGYALARRLLRPLGGLSAQATAYAHGDFDAPATEDGFAEFARVSRILSDMALRIQSNMASERARLEAELNALRNQMSPHFLFNTLNGLATMAGIDQDRTATMLTKLASLYRLILESTKATTSRLDRELEIVTLYLELEAMRFGKRLRYAVTTDGVNAGAVHIPGLILQTLVENAVKHGIGKSREGGEIRVVAQRSGDLVQIIVANNGAALDGRAEAGDGGGIGLKNTRKRLDLLYGETHGFAIGTNAAGETEVSFKISGAAVVA